MLTHDLLKGEEAEELDEEGSGSEEGSGEESEQESEQGLLVQARFTAL